MIGIAFGIVFWRSLGWIQFEGALGGLVDERVDQGLQRDSHIIAKVNQGLFTWTPFPPTIRKSSQRW